MTRATLTIRRIVYNELVSRYIPEIDNVSHKLGNVI